jgi:hypothetical protein
MIDALISTDLTALAVEDRQRVPALDAVLPQPREKTSWPLKQWLRRSAPIAAPVVAIAAGAGVLLELDIHTFQESPQLAIVIVIAIVAMLHAIADRARTKPGKPVADVIAAVMITVLAATFFLAAWDRHRATCVYFFEQGGNLGPCTDHDHYTSPGFVAIVWAAVLVIARAFASRARVDVARWSVAAKIAAVAVVVTWVSVNQFEDRWGRGVDFQLHFAGYYSFTPAQHLKSALGWMVNWPFVGVRISSSQWNALAGGLVLVIFAATIAIACVRERGRPSRWLTILEHPALTPLAVVVAMAALVYASAADYPEIVGRRAAVASVAAIVAYAGMLLRRRRREALS